MNIQISSDSVSKAYKEIDKYMISEMAKRDLNIVKDDGMTINIPEDNLFDKLVNKLDHRRVVLEKKAEILNDYYGDRLLAKDLFKDYISQKKFNSHISYLLSVGLIGANVYTRIMKNSVFIGKVGVILTIAALHSTGRYVSNNWLEERIERPWKIHNYRMSKGLGPTNTPSNQHPEIVTVPLRFHRFYYNSNDFLFGSDKKYTITALDVKTPIDKEHFPYVPDGAHHKKLTLLKEVTPERWKLQLGKYNEKYQGDHTDFFAPKRGIPAASSYMIPYYNPLIFLSKKYMKENWNIYRPSRMYKKSIFSARRPEDIRDDKIVTKNEYIYDPEFADSGLDLPEWSYDLSKVVNITKDSIDLVSNYY
jgi:hypothetical protein